MVLDKIIKFEPIDLTRILAIIFVLLIVIFAFKGQLNKFFASLENRPIKVQMTTSATTIELGAPANPELISESVSNPSGSKEQINDWEEEVASVQNIAEFQKLGFGDLFRKLASLGENELAVINFIVNDRKINYFSDPSMLKYLSIASEKVRYLAFYEDNKFVGAIKIQSVIAGLASEKYRFINFGEKIRNGNWDNFPGLVNLDSSFTKTPSIRELQEFLSERNLTEVPLLKNNMLVGFLNYRSISNELYAQASGS